MTALALHAVSTPAQLHAKHIVKYAGCHASQDQQIRSLEALSEPKKDPRGRLLRNACNVAEDTYRGVLEGMRSMREMPLAHLQDEMCVVSAPHFGNGAYRPGRSSILIRGSLNILQSIGVTFSAMAEEKCIQWALLRVAGTCQTVHVQARPETTILADWEIAADASMRSVPGFWVMHRSKARLGHVYS